MHLVSHRASACWLEGPAEPGHRLHHRPAGYPARWCDLGGPRGLRPTRRMKRRSHWSVGAAADLIDAGRLKIYCVDSFDAQSWFNLEIPLEERTYQHRRCEEWILNDVMPWIYKLRWHRGGGDLRVQPGCLPRGECLSGTYDPAFWNSGLSGVRERTSTRRAPARRAPRLAARAGQRPARLRSGPVGGYHWGAAKHQAVRRAAGLHGIKCELDLWSHDVPHDWPSWRAQLAHHMPRFADNRRDY